MLNTRKVKSTLRDQRSRLIIKKRSFNKKSITHIMTLMMISQLLLRYKRPRLKSTKSTRSPNNTVKDLSITITKRQNQLIHITSKVCMSLYTMPQASTTKRKAKVFMTNLFTINLFTTNQFIMKQTSQHLKDLKSPQELILMLIQKAQSTTKLNIMKQLMKMIISIMNRITHTTSQFIRSSLMSKLIVIMQQLIKILTMSITRQSLIMSLSMIKLSIRPQLIIMKLTLRILYTATPLATEMLISMLTMFLRTRQIMSIIMRLLMSQSRLRSLQDKLFTLNKRKRRNRL